MRRQRPRIHFPRAAVPLFAAAVVTGFLLGLQWLVVGVTLAVALFVFITWLLAPYSKWAMRRRVPNEHDFDVWHQRAERLRSAPVVGAYLRWWERWNGDPVRRAGQDSREWARGERHRLGIEEPEHEDDGDSP